MEFDICTIMLRYVFNCYIIKYLVESIISSNYLPYDVSKNTEFTNYINKLGFIIAWSNHVIFGYGCGNFFH